MDAGWKIARSLSMRRQKPPFRTVPNAVNEIIHLFLNLQA
jgi:hypothetical protein